MELLKYLPDNILSWFFDHGIKILGETKPLKQWDVTGELRKRLKIAFDKNGIEIPFPQRVIHQAT